MPNQSIADAGNLLQQFCFSASEARGWWNNPLTGERLNAEDKFCEKLALAHSELSEALEGFRCNKMDDKLVHRPMAEVELADAVIRICDLAGALGYKLGDAIAEKMEFNSKRVDHNIESRVSTNGKRF